MQAGCTDGAASIIDPKIFESISESECWIAFRVVFLPRAPEVEREKIELYPTRSMLMSSKLCWLNIYASPRESSVKPKILVQLAAIDNVNN